jgi:hypothetical protein
MRNAAAIPPNPEPITIIFLSLFILSYANTYKV